jgi:peptidoglycan/LPS O-acetylase OafA/YrhL
MFFLISGHIITAFLARRERALALDDWHPLVVQPVQLGLILGLSASSYVFVEKPLRRAQWSSSRLVTIGFGLIAIVF